MPVVIATNPDVEHSVTRPAVLEIVKQVLMWTGLNKEVPIQFPGQTETMYQPGSTIHSDKDTNRFDTNTTWKISIDQSHQTDNILSTAVTYDDYPEYFSDNDTGVYVRPVYSQVDIAINVVSRHTDEDAAIRWRDDIRTRVSMLRAERLHTVSFSFLIPPEIMLILMEVQKMREQVMPYGETFAQYIDRYITPHATIQTNLAGKNAALTIRETQTRIQGWFEFQEAPDKGSKESNSSAWNIGFTYRFKFDKPISSTVNYPLMIHNQLIDKKFRPTGKQYEVEDNVLGCSNSVGALSYFEAYQSSRRFKAPGLAIPDFDDFLPDPNSIPYDTIRVLTALTSIDEANPLNLLDLNQLGYYTLDQDIRNFMVGEAPWIQKIQMSAIHLTVYCDRMAMHPNAFSMDANLMVKLTSPPDLRKTYHVRLALYARPRLLVDEAKIRMRNDAVACNKILVALKATLEEDGYLPVAIPGSNYLPKKDFDKAVDWIDRYYDPKYNGQVYQWNTVETLYVDSSVNYHAPRPT